MKEKLLEFAKDVCLSKNIVDICIELSDIFTENALYQEKAGCYEKIWHITQEHELYQKIGDIFAFRINNKAVALNAYNKYFQFKDPDFYKKYASCLRELGYKDISPDLDKENYNRHIVNLCDRFDIVTYMVVYAQKIKDYDTVLELKRYYDILKEEVEEYYKDNPNTDLDYFEEFKASKSYLSDILVKCTNNIDINEFAIELKPENKRAYINILTNLVKNHKKEKAMAFFNDRYIVSCNANFAISLQDVCWELSKYYGEVYDFYHTVYFQKAALDIELESMGA